MLLTMDLPVYIYLSQFISKFLFKININQSSYKKCYILPQLHSNIKKVRQPVLCDNKLKFYSYMIKYLYVTSLSQICIFTCIA